MINLDLDIGIPDPSNSSYQEGTTSDLLKTVADVDTDAIKSAWDDSSNSLYDKVKALEDEGLSKGRETADYFGKIGDRLKVDNRSIIARARNSVLQFPIFVSQTLRVNEAQILANFFERIYCTLVQTVLSQDQILNEDEANELVFLKRYHTNLKEAADVFVNKYYEPIDEIDQMLCDSIFYTQKLNENCTVEFRVLPPTNNILNAECVRLSKEPLEGFIYLKEAEARDITKEESTSPDIKEMSNDDFRKLAINELGLNQQNLHTLDMDIKHIKDKNEKNKVKQEQDDLNQRIDDKVEEIKRKIRDTKDKGWNGYVYKNGRFVRIDSRITTKVTDRGTKSAEYALDAPKILKDGDLKKINSGLPWTMECVFRLKTKEGMDRDIRYVIGIKSILHLIRAQDLADDLKDIVMGNIRSLQKIRYKTGELKFKDYFFHLSSAKADALKNTNYNKRWISTLKRLAEYDKVKGTLFKHPAQGMAKGAVPKANGTLVLTQPDVTALTNQTGIDISKASIARKLAKSLFLITVAIVDSSAGSMRILYDNNSDWEVQSLATIEADIAKTDNSQLMKELQRMVNR